MSIWLGRSGLGAALLAVVVQLAPWSDSFAAAPESNPSPVSPVDLLLAEENNGRELKVAPLVDDLGFLRRATVDLIGRIPTVAEISEYESWAPSERRARLVDKLLDSDGYALRFTAFMGDMLRLRSGADGGSALTAYVHKSLKENRPYDELCRELISASGKANTVPAVGFVLGDNADPMALAGVTSQVFMGVRIACAQCHDHPFDVWKRQEFYSLAAYFGKTQRIESELTNQVFAVERNQSTVMWPPEDVLDAKDRKPMAPKFPFEVDAADGQHIVRLTSYRAELARKASGNKKEASVDDLLNEAEQKVVKRPVQETFDVAGEAKMAAKALGVESEAYRASKLRAELAGHVTNPRNRYFSRNYVNRLWNELLGRGFTMPIDDFSAENVPSHERTMDYLADEFVATGFDMKQAVRRVVLSQAYQRGHLVGISEQDRVDAEEAFVASPVRRMLGEALYDSIVIAGHVFGAKHPSGENLTTVWTYDRVPKPKPNAKKTNVQELAGITGGAKPGNPKMADGMANKMAMAGAPAGGNVYDVEKAIEVDFTQALKPQEEVKVEMMRTMSAEEIEAMRMTEQAQTEYVDRYVRTTFDDNPTFSSALKMAAPAQPNHFVRLFGQPARAELGDHRDDSASMRQSLLMLNGRLTHEAARVGSLEPVYPLLVGEKANWKAAVNLVYRETLTRDSTADDLALADEMLKAANDNPREAMADLRWILLNSHEFRFLP